MALAESGCRSALTRYALLAILAMVPAGANAALRALTPADLFRMERFGETVVSPDGKWLAYVQIRGEATAKFHMRDFMNGLDRADIWVAALDAGRPRNVTGGETDGSGWFFPSWSPDGRRLAMLSTRGGKVRLWVWEKASGKVKQVSPQGVEMATPVWLSPDVLVCASGQDGRNPEAFTMETGAAEKAMKAWPEAWHGTAATVSVLTSGPAEPMERHSGQLWKFDLARNQAGPLMDGNFSGIAASPDGHRIAMLEAAARVRPDPGELLPNRNPVKYRLVVFGDTSLHAEDVVPGSLRWSRNGKLALETRTSRRATDWVVVGGSALTASFQTPPSTLAATAEGSGFAAVADGHLWIIDADGSPARMVDSGFGRRIDSLVWSDGSTAVVSSAGQLFRADLKTEVFRQIERPAANAEFKAFVPQTGGTVFLEETPAGSHLWASGRKVASINMFLGEVAEGRLKKIEYRAQTGEPLVGWVLLPWDYQEGKRYPSVVWVYGGISYSAAPPPFFVRLSDSGPFNLQLLSARGFAVILPSMPLQPEGSASDPMQDLPKGVLPAVDKAIELGIADPQRLALMGQSYGGYSVYGLLTQTSRFQAAIAIAGFCDLVSLYGELDARFRYDDDARDHLLHMVFAESGQFRMGAPPWKDMDRYIRNSPLSYADKVTTPLMIVQGDMDYVPIQQGEEFFSALYRQNKPASFVRYWGEGHIPESPDNVADLWTRVYNWLGRYL